MTGCNLRVAAALAAATIVAVAPTLLARSQVSLALRGISLLWVRLRTPR
jgi:hypothetical protein